MLGSKIRGSFFVENLRNNLHVHTVSKPSLISLMQVTNEIAGNSYDMHWISVVISRMEFKNFKEQPISIIYEGALVTLSEKNAWCFLVCKFPRVFKTEKFIEKKSSIASMFIFAWRNH